MSKWHYIKNQLLHDYVNKKDLLTLPSISKLLEYYDVSRNTLLKAVQSLREDRLLEFSQGRSIKIIRTSSQNLKVSKKEEKPPLRSKELLYQFLINAIAEDIYLPGEPLPKSIYLTQKFNISSKTVTSVFNQLINEKRAFRAGKKLLVGQPLPDNKSNSPKYVIVLVHSIARWENICMSERTNQFGEAFLARMNRVGFRIILCVPQALDGIPIRKGVLLGKRKFTSFVQQEKRNISGILIAGDPEEIKNYKQWIQTFKSYSFTVVWLNRNGIENPFFKSRKNWYTAAFSEKNAIKTGLKHLYALGHKNIVYSFAPDPWQIKRRELIEQVHKKLLLPIKIHYHLTPHYGNLSIQDIENEETLSLIEKMHQIRNTYPSIKDSFDLFESNRNQLNRKFPEEAELLKHLTNNNVTNKVTKDSISYKGFMHYLYIKAAAKVSSKNSFLWSHARNLIIGLRFLPYLEDPSITAIIAPQDERAEIYIKWFEWLGLDVPDDISILSFDNAQRLRFRLLTTIDFGFGHLGHQAANAIIGDGTVDADRRGNINSKALVVDGGSAAPPKSKKSQ